MFFFSALRYTSDHDVYGNLVKDGEVITSAYASNYMKGDDNHWMNLQVSTSVLLKCLTGETVYVIGANWGGSTNKATEADFVAMLIHKEY